MTNTNNAKQNDDDISKSKSSNKEEQLPVKNPFDASDDKKITTDDIEKEQQFKEAQTERD